MAQNMEGGDIAPAGDVPGDLCQPFTSRCQAQHFGAGVHAGFQHLRRGYGRIDHQQRMPAGEVGTVGATCFKPLGTDLGHGVTCWLCTTGGG